jgi:hypothetical protein
MARYYTLCETTPGKEAGKSGGQRRYLRVYYASEGFLFHDTEDSLTFTDIQKALWMLSDLYEDAQRVIAICVDDNTIMATFSTYALPRPTRPGFNLYSSVKPDEYLESSGLAGWLLRDIKNPASEPIPVDYNDLYNDCIMLERVTDNCPCVKQAEGTCFPSTVYLRYPWLAANTTNYSATEVSKFHTKRYENVGGFEYISGQLATSADFSEAIRPWDNYDFRLVPKRETQFAERGQELSHRSTHRKVECSQCTFATKKHGGGYEDCGRIKDCRTHTTEEQAWVTLFDWLKTDTDFVTGTPGFSPGEINYLIKEAGRAEHSKSISDTRKVPTYLAGFHSGYSTEYMQYMVTAARGHLSRHKYYVSYKDLRMDYPMLLASADIPPITVEPKMLLAHAIYSGWPYIRGESGGWGHRNHPFWRMELQHGTMSTYGHTSNGYFHGPSLSVASHVSDYIQAKWPGQQNDICNKYISAVRRQAQSQGTLPILA